MYTSAAYLLYIIASIFITVFVSRTLSRNGKIYLVVGFYLLNLGFVLLRMRTGVPLESFEAMIAYLSGGIGFVLFAIGCAHFFNMLVIHKFRKGHMDNSQEGQDKKEYERQ